MCLNSIREKLLAVNYLSCWGIRPDRDFELNGVSITVKKEHRFLDVVLDEKIRFIPHDNKI